MRLIDPLSKETEKKTEETKKTKEEKETKERMIEQARLVMKAKIHLRADRKNKAFPDMPPLGGLGDEDISAVISYVRAKWGAAASPVTAADVKKIRDAGAANAPATNR